MREAAKGFRETQPGASTLVSLVFQEGSFVWIVVEGGEIYYAFQFDKEGILLFFFLIFLLCMYA